MTPPEGSAKEKAKEAVSETTDQAREVGQHATAAGREVSRTAIQGAQDVIGDVREQGMQLTQEATQQLQSLAGEATTQLRDHAGTQTERAASQLRTLSEQAQAFAEGRTEEAGPLPQLARDATQRLSTLAQRLEDGGVDGAMSDVRQFARRKPGTFLLLAGIAGFSAGRFFRGVRAAGEESALQQPQTPPSNIDITSASSAAFNERAYVTGGLASGRSEV